MSKKKKRKFYNSPSVGDSVAVSDMSPVSSSSNNASYSAPVSAGTPSNAVAGDVHAAEYQVIKHDLIKVVILNAIFLAAVLTLYYSNLHSHYLENFFGKILHF